MTTLSDHDQLERMRMCVAEAGYDPELVCAVAQGAVLVYEELPVEVAWRASEICELGEGPMCFECTVESRRPEMFPGFERQCRAVRRLELDCGRPR